MKLKFFFLSIIAMIFIACNTPKDNKEVQSKSDESPPVHSAKNSLDWNGFYQGTLPCTDCEGIKTEVIINMDGTYQLSEHYLGKDDMPFQAQGNFTWNKEGNKITLKNKSGLEYQFLVGEYQLFKLDKKGNLIEGELADMYRLEKSMLEKEIEE